MIARTLFRRKGNVTDRERLHVLRLNHAQLPNISATKEGGCAPVQVGWFRHPSSLCAAMPWNSIFASSVWISMFSSVGASVVPLSSTILPSRESFPVHLWFVSRFNSGCDDLFRRFAFHLSRWDQATAEDAFRAVRQLAFASAGGRNPAKYCASNPRRAAVTDDPIPTISSSTLGPSSAIQSSPRTNNRGRRIAVGLTG
jgi:hypothetical protein